MFDRITLEVSLKPFYKTDEISIRRVCASIFEQWKPLLKQRKEIGILLWTADGSELLDWADDLNAPFEWCKYMGTANKPLLSENEPQYTGLHEKKQLYRRDAPEMTYGILKLIIRCLHEEGKRLYPESRILVGETFDIGPEFAVSSFKYQRHPEICSGAKLDHLGFVDATALLHADKRAYAAYPEGIPEDLPFGTFLGAQSEKFLKAMGFDYLWLSNGLGFSSDPWNKTGKVYDGISFQTDRLLSTRKKVFEFWKLFREQCPDIPLETRGTNNSAGIDYATDGVPLYDLYHAGLDFFPPPNSPWAAIDFNYGLEIMGHMTRICGIPDKGFLFRYYIHDPWWLNSPWYDRYEGCAGDIYLPMSISRITEDGSIETANRFSILSIDNSYGEMPDECVNEPLPHILKAEKDTPDAPSPLVWVYPMREYTTASDSEMLASMYEGDNLICDAINNGLPLSCVVSTDNFMKHEASLYAGCILISPKKQDENVLNRLRQMNAVLYDKDTDLFEEIRSFGYDLRFTLKSSFGRPPVMSLVSGDNGFLLSVCALDTTCVTKLRFPMGAPILIGTEAELEDGYAVYRFPRCVHTECRIFVEQVGGVISATEFAPVNTMYPRKIRVRGLEDAVVRFYPEKDGASEAKVSLFVNDGTPQFDDGWEYKTDAAGRIYLEKAHVTGDYSFLMTKPGRKM